MGNKPGTAVSEDDLMAITAMAHVTKFDKKELELLRSKCSELDSAMVKKTQYEEMIGRIRLRKSDREILDKMFILFDETGDAMVDWKCFLVGLSLLLKTANFDEKLRFSFSLFDNKDDGRISREDCEAALKAMNETIGWFGDKNLDEENLETMVEQHFEGHPSVDAEGMYAYTENLNAFSKNPSLEGIIKKPNTKEATYRDIQGTLSK